MSALSFNPNCGACGGLNSRGYCNYTACRFPVTKTTVIINQQQKTHGDELRAMSDEELANRFSEIMDCDRGCDARKDKCWMSDSTCRLAWLDWLRQEAKE